MQLIVILSQGLITLQVTVIQADAADDKAISNLCHKVFRKACP
jgi:hypothetical protein